MAAFDHVVDLLTEMNPLWVDGCKVFCRETGMAYVLLSGVFQTQIGIISGNVGGVPQTNSNADTVGGHTVSSIVAAAIPTGAMLPFAGAAAPEGYLLCNGASYLRTDYASLFAVIGTIYGAADGTHFNVPDLRDKFVKGKPAAGNIGDVGGNKTHTHAGHDNLVHAGAAVGDHADHTHTGASTTGATHLVAPDTSGAGVTEVSGPSAVLGHNVTQPNNHAISGHDSPNHEPPYSCANFIIKI